MDLRRVSRSAAFRAFAVLGVMLVAAGAVSPAFSAKGLTTGKVKKIVKKLVPKVGNPIFIQETELVRFGPINLNVGGSAPVATFGPFTFTATCDEVDDAGNGPPLEQRGRILIDTSEDNSAVDSDPDSDDDFDAADPPIEWASEIADDPGVQEINSENDEAAHAVAPSGTRLAAAANIILLNFGGSACSFSGAFLVLH